MPKGKGYKKKAKKQMGKVKTKKVYQKGIGKVKPTRGPATKSTRVRKKPAKITMMKPTRKTVKKKK